MCPLISHQQTYMNKQNISDAKAKANWKTADILPA